MCAALEAHVAPPPKDLVRHAPERREERRRSGVPPMCQAIRVSTALERSVDQTSVAEAAEELDLVLVLVA